jgi:hypothetical protein
MANFTAQTLKMLWGRAAARCAMPECRLHLVEDATATDDEALIGENCHIVAESPDGPRGNASFPIEKREKYGNLILLCRVHHRIIDEQPNAYTSERLHELKSEHECWVKESLTGYDAARQADDERYASIVDEWVRLCHVSDWKAWTSWVLGESSSLWKEVDSDLEQARTWLLNRFWPRRYKKLESAFDNFRRVLSDFHNRFHEHAEFKHDKWRTEKFYKRTWHKDRKVYDRLVEEYEAHIALLDDLCFELTRAANHILKTVRADLLPQFREEEGLLLVQRGPNMQFQWTTYVPQYTSEDLQNDPIYPGLSKFFDVLAEREIYFSELPEKDSSSLNVE